MRQPILLYTGTTKKNSSEVKLKILNELTTCKTFGPVSAVVKDIVIDSEDLESLSTRKIWSSIPGPVKLVTVSPKACCRCDVSSEPCCPGAKSRRWIPPVTTLLGVIPRE